MPTKKKAFKATDGGEIIATADPRYIQFIGDMNKAKIPWRVYSGRAMYGALCPAVTTDDDTPMEAIIRATKVTGLKTDHLGLNMVVYP